MSQAAPVQDTPFGPYIRAIYPGTSQVLTMSASSQQFSAVGAKTTVVRIATAGQAALIAFGTNPTATSASCFLAANSSELFAIHPGDKVAVLQGGTAGSVYLTEGA